MVYTVSDVPFWSMPNVMTPNAKERGKIISIVADAKGVTSNTKNQTVKNDDAKIIGITLAIAGLIGICVFCAPTILLPITFLEY